jgi:hypothetical protein
MGIVERWKDARAMSHPFLSSPVPGEHLVLQVQPSRAESARELGGLETAMASLALSARSPIALEIAATSTPATSRAFLLRAKSPLALQHLASQIQARYPQASLRAVAADPLRTDPHDEWSVVELVPGAASYLPLRSFRAQELRGEGADPLLGILAAFTHLPPAGRAIAQLALLPAAPTWSRAHQRLAVAHPLEQERRQNAANQETNAPGLGRLAVLFILVVLLVVMSRFQKLLVPAWLVQAGATLVQGRMPVLSAEQIALLVGSGMILLALVYGGAFLCSRLAAHFARPITDPRLVAEKTARPAYQARLRLFVSTPEEAWPKLPPRPILPWRTRLAQQGKKTMTRWQRWADRGLPGFFGAVWHRERARWRGYRLRVRGRRARRAEREAWLAMLVAAYAQYHLASGGYFLPQRLSGSTIRRLLTSPRTGLFRRGGWAMDLARSRHVLSVADLAALWHLPQAQDLANLPHLSWSTARTLLAPPVLTTGQGYQLGISTHAGERVPVFFPWACLRQNMLALASTGKGKSSWLLHLARALFRARTSGALRGGLMQIDMHGDLHRLTLESVPPELEEAVVVIDLAESSRVIGLNPLDVSFGADLDKLVGNIIVLIEAIWSHSYGPRTENILEYGCKTLVAANRTIVARDPLHGPDQQYTLLDVVPLIREESFRHAVLERVHDPFLHAWWAHYFERLDARQQNEYSSSVVTKFSKFASSQVARRMLGQPRSTLNVAEMIEREQILLINCASGEVGADLAAFIGSVLLGLFHVTLAEQARHDLAERRRFLVLIDEFQALTGVDYQTMLAELRKYGGSFALATQSLAYLDRLDRSLRATVLANIDHLFAFAMSADDATLLRLEGVEPEDLVNLPNYTCYARLLLDGERLPLFSLRLDDPTPQEPREALEERRRRIAQHSHLRYARPVGEVDELLLSIQARQALLMQPGKTGKAPGAVSSASPTTEMRASTPRGTRKRRSGKGKREASQTEAGTTSEMEQQETPVIHELFTDSEPADEASEQEEEHHA